VRFVLHYQISDSDVQYALTCVEVCKGLDHFHSSLLRLVSVTVRFFRFQKAVDDLLKGSAKFEHLTNGTTKNSYGH